MRDARLAFPYRHPWPQHGRSPCAVACGGGRRRRFRQADRRRGQQLRRVRPRSYPSATGGPHRLRCGDGGRGDSREFNTIAVDDGIAMGHGGMLYSLPSRDLIADSIEYMVNAHCADALVCISNCDKITPGMLMAALRLNIPTVFVSGGPMEGGTATLVDGTVRTGLESDHRHRRRGGGCCFAAGPFPAGGERLPHLRFVLRHVHRELDELSDRSAWPGAAGQWHHAGHPHGPPGAVRASRGTGGAVGPPVL